LEHIPAVFVPAVVLAVPRLMKTTAGKLDRVSLSKAFLATLSEVENPHIVNNSDSSRQNGPVNQGLQSLVLAELVSFVRRWPSLQHVGLHELTNEFLSRDDATNASGKYDLIANHSLLLLGLDSVAAIELVWRIKQRFDVDLLLGSVRQFPLLGLADEVVRLQSQQGNGGSSTSEMGPGPVDILTENNLSADNAPSTTVYVSFSGVKAFVDWVGRSRPYPNYPSLTSATTPPSKLRLASRWQYKLERCVDSAALCVNYLTQSSESTSNRSVSVAYIGSHAGDFHAVDILTGMAVWCTQLREHIEGASVPSSDGSMVYVPSFAGTDIHGTGMQTEDSELIGSVWGLNSFTGDILWRQRFPGEMKSSLVLNRKEGTIIAGCYDGNVYVLGGTDGVVKHKLNCLGPVYASPVLSDDCCYVYTATIHGHCARFNLTAHEPESDPNFCSETGAPVYSSLTLFRVPSNSHVTSVDNDDSELDRHNKRSRIGAASQVISERLIFGCVDGRVICADSSTGICTRTMEATKPIFCTPLLIAAAKSEEVTTIFGSHDGFLRCCSIDEDGEAAQSVPLVWECDCEAAIFASPTLILDDDRNAMAVAVGTTAGDVLIVDVLDGQVLSRLRLDGEIYSSLVFLSAPFNADKDVGTIFVGCRDDKLHALTVSLS
jgi:outer membrane protein assembly factor BamB/acyl carrier protein